jgi:hypothetical protein
VNHKELYAPTNTAGTLTGGEKLYAMDLIRKAFLGLKSINIFSMLVGQLYSSLLIRILRIKT